MARLVRSLGRVTPLLDSICGVYEGSTLGIAPEPSFRFPELSQPSSSSFLRFSGKLRAPMPSTSILREVQQLYNVSDRLDSLAEQHPMVSEALASISGSVRNTATLLEVLVATKMALLSELDPADA